VAPEQEAPRLRLSRRRLLKGAGAAVGLTAVSVLVGRELYGSAPTNPWDPERLDRPVFGMLQAEPRQYPDLDAAGISAVTLAIPWSDAQPQPGRIDDQVRRDLDRVHRSAGGSGLSLALSPGLQYPPLWVEELPDARFVDQRGRVWNGRAGDDAVDGVFNREVREAQEDYLRLLAEAIGDRDLAGIRIGGLRRGELQYPPVDESGTRNTYWAFGAAAQEQSPVPGYRPGEGREDDAAAFLDWYLGALTDYARWQVDTVRESFGERPRLIVLLPSWGVRPGEVEAAVDSRLDGSTSGERRGSLAAGVDWARQVDALAAVDRLDVCTTWLDARSQGDSLGTTSPVRYLVSLAERHGLGVWGENTGDNDAEDLSRCVQRVHDLGLLGMFWMSAQDLGMSGNATLSDYARLIGAGSRED
jgi:hypothetical protein